MDPDPNFPDRPKHPDFDLLSKVIIGLDKFADAGEGFDEIMVDAVDSDSLLYMATQRIHRAMMSTASPGEIVMALYLDAFALGYHYAWEKGTP